MWPWSLGHRDELKQEPTVVNYAHEALEQEARSSQEFGDNESTHEYSEDSSEHDLDNLYQSSEPMVDGTERDDNVTSGGVSVFPKPEPIGSDSEMNDTGSDTSDDDCQILKCHETVPLSDDESAFQYRSEIKIEALWEKAHECVSAATGAVLQKARNRSECASTSETSNIIDNRNEFASTSETSNIVEILDDLLLSCPVCEYSDKSQKKCVRHITDNHPDYRFKCRLCTRDFTNFHTKYRHEREHQPPTKFCSVCGKGFYFQSELNKHVGVHSEVLLYGCTTCGKHFTQAESLGQHQEIHSNKTFVCSVCNKVCETQDRYYSHYRGAHGKGCTAKCGKHYQWPAAWARHQDSCDDCKEIIKKEFEAKEKCKKFKTVSGPI